jgi:hypothetical protein
VRPHGALVITNGEANDRSLRTGHFAPSPAASREHDMEALTPVSLVHFYDTRSRRIACGVSGFDHRSTKHRRQVTCPACVALLGERPSLAEAPGPDSDASAGAAP